MFFFRNALQSYARHTLFILSASLLLFPPTLAFTRTLPATIPTEGTVTYCADGDTVKLNNTYTVRLSGIDTPETAHGDTPAQYYGNEARDILRRLIQGKKVRLMPTEKSPDISADRYKRILAELLLEDGSSANKHMLRIGAAFVYPHKEHRQEYLDDLIALQSAAIKERSGMWEYILEQPFAQQQYTGNRNSKRFQAANCPAVANISKRNQVYFSSLEEAFLAGYAPTRECLFWPDAEAARKK